MSGLHEWLQEKSDNNNFFLIKRLSANDTGATGGHQVGLYIPSNVVGTLFPSINHTNELNPSVMLTAHVSSHVCPDSQARAIYYNSRYFGKTRNEKRITRWGRGSPLQDTENTGALTLLAFDFTPEKDCEFVDIWVCINADEEDIIESMIGEVLPGVVLFDVGEKIFGGFAFTPKELRPTFNIPIEWKNNFPTGREIIRFAAEHYSESYGEPDKKLIERRHIEYQIFLHIEEIHVLDIIRKGFGSVGEFISMANSVSNRRKSRAGKSLELHLEQLFIEHGLAQFSTQVKTEGNKKPDFLFPSELAYRDTRFPDNKLRMLAVKTTCKDRWRQILNEANRIKNIHLFTLQEGVSLAQFREMRQEGVTLVVPSSLHKKYPEEIRDNIMTLGEFIEELCELYAD
ncbi:type II restriction endonuclease [Lonsdalea populi]|uniref:type II restriction endonuclease n=1 Tax=Lonsdalea populi TaxID=1172565 RepID=UPI000A20013C|nr:type II restriction endonuclease [Lonsdalea populi]OSN02195.1 restriction endonuclease [Lonsdalea populi]QPQ23268.1 type II restriction endonuclease [Lonsdalea populi]RAT46867.1 restriction endonuclease [Lonsdalea populi]RAT47274.1 restriction endonuclease [Lonsdalea populi]RAT58896.1 restriction endonuclease [Lonsdalea populi]